MANILPSRVFAACIALATAGALPGAPNAETFVGSNVDARVLVAVTAPQDGVQALLPDGWTSRAHSGRAASTRSDPATGARRGDRDPSDLGG